MDDSRGTLIVVGVDGSPGSDHALSWALDLARRMDGSVEAVTAWSADAGVAAGSLVLPLSDISQAERILIESIDRARANAADDLPPVASRAVPGSPGAVLVEASHRAEMLVIGSHGHNRLYELVLGSTTDHCVRHATCAVVVIPVHLHDPNVEQDAVALPG
jgi:nucleotide-binding universal stress UspA family protein